jgi:glycosyltransferase involved in cell wall biosynthesis
LCSGLGRINRGHEVFARDLFAMLQDGLDIVLFKGGGECSTRERTIDHIPRESDCLGEIHVAAAPKWVQAVQEDERMRVEAETFAYAALKPLLEGHFDVIHCLEREVCTVLYGLRHLFARTPGFLWSNGGALPAREQPPCDFVQEHTEFNLRRSAPGKAFVIPHGVDLTRFHPGIKSDFRARHGIPADAFVVISVGSICYWHKRMDHVIREVSAVPGAWLVMVGQPTADTPAIEALGRQLMPGRIVFATLPHDELPQAYAAANVFALGSLMETFGIVYIEAMAMGLPVVCTQHPNQRSIVQKGVFIDMKQRGALTDVLSKTPRADWPAIGRKGLEVVQQRFDLALLKQQYLARYAAIAAAPAPLPRYSWRSRLAANARNAWKAAAGGLG